MVTEKPINLDLADDFKDEEFKKHFFRNLAQTEVAQQIIKMRDKRAMRQVDLAEKAEMKQSAISRIEQADYASWNFQTLLRIAEALGARLRVHLEPIEDTLDASQEKEYAEERELHIVGTTGREMAPTTSQVETKMIAPSRAEFTLSDVFFQSDRNCSSGYFLPN